MTEIRPSEEVTFHLARDEVAVYDRLCKYNDVDPERYRSGQEVTAPAFHWIEIASAYLYYGDTLIDYESKVDDIVNWVEAAGDIVSKFEKKANQKGLEDTIEQMMQEDSRIDDQIMNGIQHGPSALDDENLDEVTDKLNE